MGNFADHEDEDRAREQRQEAQREYERVDQELTDLQRQPYDPADDQREEELFDRLDELDEERC